MAFDPAAAWAHIDSLAAEHELTVKLVERQSDSEAYIAARTAFVPQEMTPVNYLVALHELGHLASALARRMHFERVHRCSKGSMGEHEAYLACEAAAWAWAWDKCDDTVLKKVGKKTLAEVLRMLGSHLTNF